MVTAIKAKSSGRGGYRPGAGRKPGSKTRASVPERVGLEELARQHTEIALAALIEIATRGRSDAARVTAASALLDRGYGRPRQSVEHTGGDGGPLEIIVTRIFVGV